MGEGPNSGPGQNQDKDKSQSEIIEHHVGKCSNDFIFQKTYS